MFSLAVAIWTNDGHPIYDLSTGKCLNYGVSEETGEPRGSSRNVILHDHVWVGYNCMLLYGTEIGSGSIVGAKSLVKGKFPNNCILAGHPAKIIRKDIAWSRKITENGLEDIPEAWRQPTAEKW